MAARFDDAVLAAVDQLPFEMAMAVWLVDVCHCSSNEAASVGVTRSRFTGHLHDARRQIATGLGFPLMPHFGADRANRGPLLAVSKADGGRVSTMHGSRIRQAVAAVRAERAWCPRFLAPAIRDRGPG